MSRGKYDRSDMAKYPLRKVISTYNDGIRMVELLECGHVIAQKQDMYGHTNAYRRRCWKCKNNIPSEKTNAIENISK